MKTQKRIVILSLFVMCFFSTASFFSILNYMDPYQNPLLSSILLGISFIFSITSFLTVILYFIKKIYFRGEVSMYHIFSSLRQAFFINLVVLAYILLEMYAIPVLVPALVIATLFVLLELLWKNLES